ncbi:MULTISPECIES: hypothetical protein [Nostocales]|uniref:Serine kinase n=3 Tax=Nostocales TaxID=1161 RepID=A0A0C1N8A0_9CYAN|nr:hypothetical protein [Tolypothrix bouteillei]KAF3886911.1 hypothetical protein DA73_0400016510 [Tolypothrix bouteillei VB521301]
MKIYKAYNLCIASELPLAQLIETEDEPDIIVRFGKVDRATAREQEGSKNVVGGIPEVGEFLIRDGQEIVMNPVPHVDETLLSTVILGPVLCVLLRQRGLLVLHASCIRMDKKAVAFMGGSGWGKSTLAAAFHSKGYDILTDDAMAIQFAAGNPIVIPAYPQFKLFPEALTSLGHDTKGLHPVFQNASKLSYKFARGFYSSPLPLERIYVLAKGTSHEIVKLQPQEAFIELVRHTRAMKVMTDAEFMNSHMRLCGELIKNISFCRFTRKPGLTDLPQLVKLIENDLIPTSNCDQKTMARIF